MSSEVGISSTGKYVNRGNLPRVRREFVQQPEMREMVSFLDAYSRMATAA